MRHLFEIKQLNNMSKLIAVVLTVVLVLWYPVSVVKAAADDETVITSSDKNDVADTAPVATAGDVDGTSGDGDIVVTGALTIDGHYGDWEGYPKTTITYSSNNAECNHYGQLAISGDKLFGHFKANDLYTGNMQIQIWYININGRQFPIQIQNESGGRIDWSKGMPTATGTYTGLKMFFGYSGGDELGSNVALTIYDSVHGQGAKGDEIEFSLSLSKLAEYTGIDPDQMGTITIYNPNLGGQGVTIAGSSTAPWLGIAICLVAVGGVTLYRRKKKKSV